MRQVMLALFVGLGIGIGMGVVLLVRPAPPESQPDGLVGRGAGSTPTQGPQLDIGRRDAPSPTAGPAPANQPGAAPTVDPPSPVVQPKPPWVIPYEGPDLEFESAVSLVGKDVTERDVAQLFELQYLPGLADVRPSLSDRQREEILSYLRSTARDYLLAERVEVGLRGHLQEEARVKAVRIQAQSNRTAMRYIRERVLTREQESRLPPYWRD